MIYVLFECSECNKMIAYLEDFADGHICDCGGRLIPINKGNRNTLIRGQPGFITFVNKQIKPPIGLMPRYAHEEQRRNDIADAIARYMEAGKLIPDEWVEEYNELISSGR